MSRPGRLFLLSALVALSPAQVSHAQIGGMSCVGLSPPVTGTIAVAYAPQGRFAGHWGVDYQGDEPQPVRAAAAGRVTFAGLVAGNRTTTLDHGGGLRTSYSFLDETTVRRGQWIGRGDVVGQANGGQAHALMHFSVRRHGAYVDPEPLVGCLARVPSSGLRLVEPPG